VALQARRWLPKRQIVLVGDSNFAVLDLLDVNRRAKGTPYRHPKELLSLQFAQGELMFFVRLTRGRFFAPA
jgi:hypothetical protein